MPSRERYLETLVDDYLAKKSKRGKLAEKNADAYRPRILFDLKTLHEAGLNHTPSTIGEKEIDHLLTHTYAGKETSYRRWEISILNGFLKHYGNKVIEGMYLGWPQDKRVHVDWLTPQEAIMMLEAARGVERIIIHLELRLWLRRIEVLRLTPEDVLDGVLNVHGKGRYGGKWRTLAFAPETLEEIQQYETLREEIIEKARKNDPLVAIPDKWIIYERGGNISPYSESGIDSIVARVARRAGIQRTITNHTLRRTGARIAYFAGVAIVEIMEGLGHTSEKETIKYLGLTVDELAKAQAKVFDYLQKVRVVMQGQGAAPQAVQPIPRVSR